RTATAGAGCNRPRASVGNAGGNARPSLTNATLAASRLLHRSSPTAPCSKGALAAHRKKLAAFSSLGAWPRLGHNFANALAVSIDERHWPLRFIAVAKLADEPRMVGQPYQAAREYWQAFEID